jgi:hypothetical protein
VVVVVARHRQTGRRTGSTHLEDDLVEVLAFLLGGQRQQAEAAHGQAAEVRARLREALDDERHDGVVVVETGHAVAVPDVLLERPRDHLQGADARQRAHPVAAFFRRLLVVLLHAHPGVVVVAVVAEGVARRRAQRGVLRGRHHLLRQRHGGADRRGRPLEAAGQQPRRQHGLDEHLREVGVREHVLEDLSYVGEEGMGWVGVRRRRRPHA